MPASRTSAREAIREREVTREAVREVLEELPPNSSVATAAAIVEKQKEDAAEGKQKHKDKIGKLLITVVEARGLRVADASGSSDPFVVLKHGDQNHETAVIKKNLNPKWRQQFKFVIRANHEPTVHIRVLDKDLTKKEDFLGAVELQIAQLRRHAAPVDDWFDLLPSGANPKPTGSIHLKIEYIPTEGEASAQMRFSSQWSNNPNKKIHALSLGDSSTWMPNVEDNVADVGFETPREYMERNVPKAANIDELISAIGDEGFERAADIPLTLDFAFRNAFLLCEEATKELISSIIQSQIVELENIEQQAVEDFDSLPLMLRAVSHDGLVHIIILNMKPYADDNFVWKSVHNASYGLQYILSTTTNFNNMGKVIQINFVNRTALDAFASVDKKRPTEENYHVKLQLRNSLTSDAVFLPELDFLEIHYFLLDRLPESYEATMSIPPSVNQAEETSHYQQERNLPRRESHLILLQWLHYLKSNLRYPTTSEWPNQLINNINILRLVQIISVLSVDEEFVYKLGQHEMDSTARMRSFLQIENLKRENQKLRNNKRASNSGRFRE